jgi:TIR domain
MKVFLSWSGTRSHNVAALLKEWLSSVIQACDPWLSSTDIERGQVWFSAIQDELMDTNLGIICLTEENKNSPWILFEAGALLKGLSNARVITLLIDLQPKDIEGPLAQFNHTALNQEDLLKLIKTLNGKLGENSLDERRLEQIFEVFWPTFKSKFDEIFLATETEEKKPQRKLEDMVAEVLENTRELKGQIGKVTNTQFPEGMSSASPWTLNAIANYLATSPKRDLTLQEIAMNLPSDIERKAVSRDRDAHAMTEARTRLIQEALKNNKSDIADREAHVRSASYKRLLQEAIKNKKSGSKEE